MKKEEISLVVNGIMTVLAFILGVYWFGWWFLVPGILLKTKYTFK